MADTVRLAMLKKLTERLQEISVENGYALDLEERVYRGRTFFGKETQTPFISLIEAAEQPETTRKGGVDITHIQPTIFVQGFAADDKENPTDPAYALLGCILQALGPLISNNKEAKADGIVEFEMSAGYVCPPNDQVSKTAFCVVEIKPTYKESVGDPYPSA